jgi:hypothetical protein
LKVIEDIVVKIKKKRDYIESKPKKRQGNYQEKGGKMIYNID